MNDEEDFTLQEGENDEDSDEDEEADTSADPNEMPRVLADAQSWDRFRALCFTP